MSQLTEALKRKYKTPQEAVIALGLDASILNEPSKVQLKELFMSAKPQVLSRKAILAQGVIAGFLLPKLATDARVDLAPAFEGVSAKNFKEKKPSIIEAVTKIVEGKLAKDAKIDDLPKVMDAMEEVEPPEGADADPNSGLPMSAEEMRRQSMDAEEGEEGEPDEKKKFLMSKLSAEDWATYDQMCQSDAETTEMPEEMAKKKEAMMAAKDAEEKEKVTKPVMDAALKATHEAAVKDTITQQNAIREAEKAVRPYVGELAVAHDSAESVYRTALGLLHVAADDLKDLPLAALKAVLKAQPDPRARKATETTSLGMDAAAAKSFAERFPGSGRIGVIG